MKFSLKTLLGVAMLVALLVAMLAVPAFAVTPSKETATTTLGAASFTNAQDYVVRQLRVLDVANVLPVVSTGTLVYVSDSITSTVATVTTAAGGAMVPITNTVYVFKSGILRLSGLGTNTGANVRFVFDNYP